MFARRERRCTPSTFAVTFPPMRPLRDKILAIFPLPPRSFYSWLRHCSPFRGSTVADGVALRFYASIDFHASVIDTRPGGFLLSRDFRMVFLLSSTGKTRQASARRLDFGYACYFRCTLVAGYANRKAHFSKLVTGVSRLKTLIPCLHLECTYSITIHSSMSLHERIIITPPSRVSSSLEQ